MIIPNIYMRASFTVQHLPGFKIFLSAHFIHQIVHFTVTARKEEKTMIMLVFLSRDMLSWKCMICVTLLFLNLTLVSTSFYRSKKY